MKIFALLGLMLTILLAISACAPSGPAGQKPAETQALMLRPDPATWPEGFAAAAGPHLAGHIQVVLMDPHKSGYFASHYEALQALKGQHPEWKDHVEYLLKLRWMY